MSLVPTASQTAGPFFHLGLTYLGKDNLFSPGTTCEQITVEGRILDADGSGACDALIELWQADSDGRYVHGKSKQGAPDQQGFGRILTREEGRFSFTTIKPGRVPGPGETLQAPHIVVTIFGRGLLKQLITRIYFPDEPGNAEDPVLAMIPAERRSTLIARRASGERNVFEWNIVLQGEGETVFFDW